MIMAPVAIDTLWHMMLDASTGVINYFIDILGFDSISFLSNSKTVMASVIFRKHLAADALGYRYCCRRTKESVRRSFTGGHR